MMNMFMKRRIAAKKNRKKGFTLIEVIVVIVIIAILAAIAVPSLTRYIGTAGLRADMATAHNIQVILQAELSHQFVDGIDFVAHATDALQSTINGEPIVDILADNGVTLTTDQTLTDVTVVTGSAKLSGFLLTTSRSTVEYDGTILDQTPL